MTCVKAETGYVKKKLNCKVQNLYWRIFGNPKLQKAKYVIDNPNKFVKCQMGVSISELYAYPCIHMSQLSHGHMEPLVYWIIYKSVDVSQRKIFQIRITNLDIDPI